MWAAIAGFLTALPQILQMVQSFMTWVNKVSGGDTAGFMVRLGNAFDQLSKAQSEEEYQAAAKSLADSIRNLP